MRDILGIARLSSDQEEFLDKILLHNRVLAKASNSVGKTFILSAVGVWYMDAVAAQLDSEGREQGALWIMTAPDASTVDSTIWAQALGHIQRAERNGYPMAGWFSEKSVLWRVRAEDWFIEKLSPPKRVGQEQQHGASGRHHDNLLITIDEGPGVDSARYRAAEGMASGLKNKIIVAGNPTEIAGPYAEKAENGEYVVIRISALNHPNVIERREVIPGGAVNHVVTDSRIKLRCFDRGPFDPENNIPDPKFHDFLYRLHPWVGTEQVTDIPDPRPADETVEVDGIQYRVIGHSEAPIHVFRPDSYFLSSVMGEFPLERSGGLFPGSFIDRAFEEWLKLAATNEMREIEKMPYDRVGVDPAEEGGDSPMIAPLWIRGGRKIFDRIRDVARGMDYEVAGHAYTRCGKKPEYIVDSIGVGSGVATRLDTDYGCTVVRFKASEAAWNNEDAGEPEFYNKRAAAYWRASILLRENKVLMPPDSELKEEMRAHGYENRNGKILVTPKKKVRDLIGRSPDKCLVAGTIIATRFGDKPIEEVVVGDEVLTRAGWRRVIQAGKTADSAMVYTALTDDGWELTGTANHPVYVVGRGFTELGDLRAGDELWTKLSSTGESTGVTRSLSRNRVRGTSTPTAARVSQPGRSTEMFTSTITARFQTAGMSTTEMATSPTITPVTLRPCQPGSTSGFMALSTLIQNQWLRLGSIATSLRHGMAALRGWLGIVNIARNPGRSASQRAPFVRFVTASLRLTGLQRLSSVHPLAATGSTTTEIGLRAPVRGAGPSSTPINTARPQHVVARVASVTPLGSAATYNLSVEGENEYFANGILVHNCDAWVMGLWEEREKEEGGGIYAPMGGRAGSGPPTDYSMYQKAR